MPVADDALMALILRFVVNTDDDVLGNEEYLQRQLKVLRKHLARFPEEERSTRAMEWIGEHAARYRRDWERNSLADRTVYLRCADCPLADIDATEQCEIHEQWLYLLHRYLAGETMTRDYVEDCLALLRDYKARHAGRLKAASIVAAETQRSAGRKGKKKKKNKEKKKKGKGKGRKDASP